MQDDVYTMYQVLFHFLAHDSIHVTRYQEMASTSFMVSSVMSLTRYHMTGSVTQQPSNFNMKQNTCTK